MNPWLFLAIFAAVVVAVVLAARPRYQMRVVVQGGTLRRFEGLPRGQAAMIAEFLQRDLAFSGRVTILATKCRDGYLRVAVRGPVDAGTRQRIRNFLIAEL